MRLTAITFDGYGSGETDFSKLISASPPPARLNDLNDFVTLIAGQITNPLPNQFVSIIIVGHSDRQDQANLSCDQRRASEISAATNRANSAWEWVKQAVSTEVLSQSGVQAGDWWETSPHITWGLVYAAAGMLQYDPPTADQRSLNRRVVMLISVFNPD